ncbi:WxcM-like domain-containing protein, partial [Campylobacter coli]|nr:WxcM-like domain-containing protein [Campylobacter coli]EAJ0862332.1 WxcM-like domain-containing protein [Campylobacter coli]EAJ2517111.1 WxcM-like domain-containing protein [Campylobacter coli]EAL1465316.1 WxcM-like domain-containing protein [Campylobacter coli]
MITKKINCKLINLKYFDDKNS